MNILVIGSNSNMGSFFCKKWVETHNLYLHYNKNDDKIKYFKNAHFFKFDVEGDLENIEIPDDFSVDAIIIFFSVRSSDYRELIKTSPKFWKYIINQNIFGTYNVLHKFIPYFNISGGNIVLLGSNVSRIGLPYGSAYSASKAAIANIGKSLAYELGSRNIRINTISPGPIKVDNEMFNDDYKIFREEYFQKQLSLIPLNRVATVEDLQKIIEYYLFENSYCSGEEIFVTGGKL